VISDIEIAQSEILNIGEGVTIIFQGPYSLQVKGCLKALGSFETLFFLAFMILQVFKTTP